MSEECVSENKKYCVWVNSVNKIIYLKEVANTKKIVFDTEEASLEFASKLLFKGYTIG